MKVLPNIIKISIPTNSHIFSQTTIAFLIFYSHLTIFLTHISSFFPLLPSLQETDNSDSSDGLFKHITASPPSRKLMNLTPATKYEVMVVVLVSKSEPNLTCVAEGKGRERVHTVFFTTTCPEGKTTVNIYNPLRPFTSDLCYRSFLFFSLSLILFL